MVLKTKKSNFLGLPLSVNVVIMGMQLVIAKIHFVQSHHLGERLNHHHHNHHFCLLCMFVANFITVINIDYLDRKKKLKRGKENRFDIQSGICSILDTFVIQARVPTR